MEHLYEVVIEGISPLLQNNPTGTKPKSHRRNHESEIDEDELRMRVYYSDDGTTLQHPATAIQNCLIEAANEFKASRRSMKTPVKRSVFVEGDMVPIINKKLWDRIHLLRPRNSAGQVTPYYAPEFAAGWQIKFRMELDDEMVAPAKVKEILDFAGKRIGIGVHRPKFGRFIVTEFKEAA